jgi:hypothetical protein
MHETTKSCQSLRSCTCYVCAQPSPTWLVLPAAETAVLDLEWLPLVEQGVRIVGLHDFYQVIDRAHPHYLRMITHFWPKVNLVTFTKKPTKCFLKKNRKKRTSLSHICKTVLSTSTAITKIHIIVVLH